MIPVHRLRHHALLSLAFMLTRVLLYAVGLEFNFALDWMWLADPADLRDRLAETVYYFHAFPPGMNLLTGVILKLGGAEPATLALAVFWTLGLAIVNALFHLLRTVGVSAAAAFALSLAFVLLPQTIYFEHLYLYEYPVTAMLMLAAVLFHAGVMRPTASVWSGFFLVIAAIGLTRSTFHLVWFSALVALALWCVAPQGRTRVLRAACVPAVLLLALYVKNFAVFGTFDAFTFGPVSQNLVTVWRLPPDLRDVWIEQGRLSRLAAVSVYAGPRDYVRLSAAWASPVPPRAWPPQMTRLDRPSVGAPNYNHWVFIEVNRIRRADAVRAMLARPAEYLTTVRQGLVDLFTPSTRWHPRDGDASPHARHRETLGWYEAVFARVVHGIPAAPIGLYVFMPVVMALAALRARRLLGSTDGPARAAGALVVFCLFQVGYVTAASTLFTFRESARYRFQVEPFIWLLAAVCVASLWRGRANRVAAAT